MPCPRPDSDFAFVCTRARGFNLLATNILACYREKPFSAGAYDSAKPCNIPLTS
jgi:hypothetical protein